MRRAVAFAAILPIALGACAGPPIATVPVPPVAAPEAWRDGSVPAGSGQTAPVAADWWTAFGDPALTALVEQALARNDEIGIAAARVREARALAIQADASALPTLDAGVGGAASRTVSAFGTPLEQRAAQPQVTLSYEVDLFGALADGRSAAAKALLASQDSAAATRLMVSSSVASAYITLCALDARLAIVRQTLAARGDARKLARSRAAAGYSPELERRQADAEYEATAALVPAIEGAIAQRENALSVLVGAVPGAIARGRRLAELHAPAVPGLLPSQVLAARPDIAAAAAQLAGSDAGLAAARKRFLPRVQLGASAGVAFSTLLANPITLFSAGGSVLAPLFEGGRLRAQAESAASRRDAAAFAYRRAVLNALGETQSALVLAQKLDQQRATISAQRDALQAALTLAENRYRAGYSPYLEQLDAERGELGAELALVDAEAAVLQNRVLLVRAMGGGWPGDRAGDQMIASGKGS